MDWATRVASKGKGPQSIGPLLRLHKDRWAEWEKYIDTLKSKGYIEERREERKWNDMLSDLRVGTLEYDFVAALSAKESGKHVAWGKRRLRKGDDCITLNAGFGSLNTTSDLDVNVVSTTPHVLEVWMDFTRAFVEGRADSKRETANSFCEYWDSNFYYEPGVRKSVQIQSRDGFEAVPLTEVLMDEGFEWTTKDTALYELSCVKAYCDAYEGGKNIVMDGRVSSPNPKDMTLSSEQMCYRTSLFFAENFRTACERGTGDEIRYAYLKYAVTKIEGLVSVTSLAVCDVFGKGVFSDFKLKTGKGAYIQPYMAGISAYEMLRNLRMHSKVVEGVLLYKSKYANRLMYALNIVKGLCRTCGLNLKESIPKSNAANLRTIERAMTVMLDFMDGIDAYEGSCLYVENDEWVNKLESSLKILCTRAFEYIEGLIKEETSEKKRGIDYVKELLN